MNLELRMFTENLFFSKSTQSLWKWSTKGEECLGWNIYICISMRDTIRKGNFQLKGFTKGCPAKNIKFHRSAPFTTSRALRLNLVERKSNIIAHFNGEWNKLLLWPLEMNPIFMTSSLSSNDVESATRCYKMKCLDLRRQFWRSKVLKSILVKENVEISFDIHITLYSFFQVYIPKIRLAMSNEKGWEVKIA